MTNNIEQKLEADGWVIECELPLEIRHEDGSFASMQAAKALTRSYEQEEALTAQREALIDIARWVKLAKRFSASEEVKNLLNAVEERANSVLPRDD